LVHNTFFLVLVVDNDRPPDMVHIYYQLLNLFAISNDV
jgi:hypothetical protein